MKLTHFSLFSGVGGIDLSAEWAGFHTVGQCEFADYPTRVLEKHWPNVPRWRDVRDVTAQSVRERGIGEITLLSGGFPCQPHSVAGKRRASADERDLWGEFARIIREIRPKWVLAENVPGLLSSKSGRFFGRVLRDLAEMGYSAGWCVYGADAVGAPHRRDRVFIVAHTTGAQCSTGSEVQRVLRTLPENGTELHYANRPSETHPGNVADTLSLRQLQPQGGEQEQRGWAGNGGQDVANTDNELPPESGRTRAGWTEPSDGGLQAGCRRDSNHWAVEPDVGECFNGISATLDGGGLNANAKEARPRTEVSALREIDGTKTHKRQVGGFRSLQPPALLHQEVHGAVICQRCALKIGVVETDFQVPWGLLRSVWGYGEDTRSSHRREFAERLTREYPDFMRELSHYTPPPCPSCWAKGSWESGIPRVAHGIKNRADRLKALGNAVVPQQCYPILAAIAEIERSV